MKKYKLLLGLLILGMSISACSKTDEELKQLNGLMKLNEYFNEDGRFIYEDDLHLWDSFVEMKDMTDEELIQTCVKIYKPIMEGKNEIPYTETGLKNRIKIDLARSIYESYFENDEDAMSRFQFEGNYSESGTGDYEVGAAYWDYIREIIKTIPYETVAGESSRYQSWEEYSVAQYEFILHLWTPVGQYMVLMSPTASGMGGDYDNSPGIMQYIDDYNHVMDYTQDINYTEHWAALNGLAAYEFAIHNGITNPADYDWASYTDPNAPESRLWKNYQAYLNLVYTGYKLMYQYMDQPIEIEYTEGKTTTLKLINEEIDFNWERRNFTHFDYQDILAELGF